VQSISVVSDLTDSPEGIERLDLLCMPLIVIGELEKKIDKITDQSLLKNYAIIPFSIDKSINRYNLLRVRGGHMGLLDL
jgi:hypothetical protein